MIKIALKIPNLHHYSQCTCLVKRKIIVKVDKSEHRIIWNSMMKVECKESASAKVNK